MEDSANTSNLGRSLSISTIQGKEADGRSFAIASLPKALLHNMVTPIVSLKRLRLTRQCTGQLFVFLLKMAALEVARRISEARWPLLWKGIQGIGLLKYPPFSWLQKWTPFRHLIKGAQEFSTPVLFLSIATAFVGFPEEQKDVDDEITHDAPNSVPTTSGELEAIERNSVEIPESVKQGTCLRLIKEKLEEQDIILPDRINDDELERFYIAAGGDLSRLILLVKKTIWWREGYYFLTRQELERWSRLVFWHGSDGQFRPCLVIRLGLACSCLQPDERPGFAQAVVSQVEYGVLHLINPEDPRITVLMDCEGISTFKFPVQMMKSCSLVVQQHYPTRLAALFVVHLSPVVRVIAQAIIQVLKPVTREKVHIEGDLRILAEHLQSVPLILGGDCECSHCIRECVDDGVDASTTNDELEHGEYYEEELGSTYENELSLHNSYNHILRVAILGLLMVWIIVALLAGFYDPEQPVIPT